MLIHWLRALVSGRPDPESRTGKVPTPAQAATSGSSISPLHGPGRGATREECLATLSGNPDAVETCLERVRLLAESGRHLEALDHAGHAARAAPRSSAAWLALGLTERVCGHAAQAEASFRRAAEIDSRPGTADVEVARSALARHDADAALAAIAPVVEADPSRVDALSVQALGLAAIGRVGEAIDCIRSAITIAPEDAVLLCQLAAALSRSGDLAGADEAFARAARVAASTGQRVNTWSGRAEVARLRGDFASATDLLLEGYRRVPDSATLFQLSELLIARGWFRSGWACYEARRLESNPLRPQGLPHVPEWEGQDLAGRTVLVVSEQGVGDVCWFARYLRPLKDLGANVVLLPRKDMGQAARRFDGVDRVMADGELYPAIDYRVGLMSLAHRFGTTADRVPAAIPYMRADPVRVDGWRRELGNGSGPRIGLVWAGREDQPRNATRSIPLERLVPLLRVRGATFLSLQKGPAEAELASLPTDVCVRALGPSFTGLEDLVDAIAAMDLVISVCTGPAHIAGALGVPVWTLISSPPDMRWMLRGDASPWYPGMRLFRQPEPGDWHSVVAAVCSALEDRLRNPTKPEKSFSPAAALANDEPRDLGIDLPAIALTTAGDLLLSPAEDVPSASLAQYGEFDRAGVEFAVSLCRAGDLCVDLHAGAGYATIALARAVASPGRVLAIEDRSAMRVRLARNLAANEVANVSIVEVPSFQASGEAGERDVDGLSLDRVAFMAVRFGADATRILGGAQATLWRCRPWLYIEGSERFAPEGVVAALRSLGYRTFRREMGLFPPRNFNRRQNDVFGGRRVVMLCAFPEERDPPALPAGCVEWSD